MKTYLKPMMLAALLSLPLLGVASAGPVNDMEDRRTEIRQALRDHRDDLNTARVNKDEDGIINAKARIHEDEALLQQNRIELSRLNAQPDDVTQTYMIKKSVVTTKVSPYNAEFAPQYMVRHDPVTGKPFYVRIDP